MVESEHWDVVVIGAGAAGLLAASCAAERGRRTLLLEKNERPGVKILMSGGTRCNVTQATDVRGIVKAYGTQGTFLHSALAALSPEKLIQWLNQEGVATKVEPTGKIFPVSNRAADVLDALLHRLEKSGAELTTGEPVLSLGRTGDHFSIETSDRKLTARRVILTTGGRSYPSSGTTGDGYQWAADLGHTIIEPCPALTPITTDAHWVRALQGVTVPDVKLAILPPEEGSDSEASPEISRKRKKTRPLAESRGSFLFTHFGVSGEPVLNISRVVSRHPEARSLRLMCDLLPGLTAEQAFEWIDGRCRVASRKFLQAILGERLPKSLAETLCSLSGVPATRRACEISKSDRRKLSQLLKQTPIPISGVMGFKKAEVTAGGVSLNEVNSSTMESKLVPGLYLSGEILDLDGPVGGYNFQAAFSTGTLAGLSIP